MLRKEVIVDTNALLIPGEFGVDIFYELEMLGYGHVIVPEKVLNELNKLKQRPDLKGKEKRAAKIGYSLVLKYVHTSKQEQMPGKPLQGLRGSGAEHHRCKVTINEGGGGEEIDTDEWIAELALKKKAAVLTNDEKLRRQLSKAGIATVYLRGKNRLEESR
ncbi:MAG: PIN domain-containing protein [Halobacteriota archaeon]